MLWYLLFDIAFCCLSRKRPLTRFQSSFGNVAYGLSFAVLKKDLLVALELDDLPGLSRRYKQITAGFQNAAWALLAHYVYDLIDPTYDPIRATQTWLSIADERVELHSWYARIIQDDILTRSLTSASMSSALLRFSALSLVDLAILVWRMKNAHTQNDVVQVGLILIFW